MPHSLVVAQFNPAASAYWLPRSGRLAASKIPCSPFWAIRFSLTEQPEEDPTSGALLCAISSTPQGFRLPNASLTLGPKFDIDTGEVSTDTGGALGPQLLVWPSIPCLGIALHQPLYVHTVPTVMVMEGGRIADDTAMFHQLDPDSLRLFRSAVITNRQLIYQYWECQQKELLKARLPYAYAVCALDDDSNWPLFNGHPDPTYMFGELHNPHAYCFDFNYGDPDHPLPFCDYPTVFYSQLAIYAQ